MGGDKCWAGSFIKLVLALWQALEIFVQSSQEGLDISIRVGPQGLGDLWRTPKESPP